MTPLRQLCALVALVCALSGGVVWGAEPVTAGPAWIALTPAQRQTLAPLQQDWNSIEANRKQKWVELAAKFPTMPAEERMRIQARMAEWARLTPSERARARLQFQEAQQLPIGERQERWKAYQALSPDERQTLAQRASPSATARALPASSAALGAASSALASASAVAGDASGRSRPIAASASAGTNSKRNLVQATAPVPSRVVSPATAPMVVQARPGATTSNMTTRAVPPSHNQAGLPKIAATPGYVDRNTLLPRRGPQGAAVRAAASADPAEQP